MVSYSQLMSSQVTIAFLRLSGQWSRDTCIICHLIKTWGCLTFFCVYIYILFLSINGDPLIYLCVFLFCSWFYMCLLYKYEICFAISFYNNVPTSTLFQSLYYKKIFLSHIIKWSLTKITQLLISILSRILHLVTVSTSKRNYYLVSKYLITSVIIVLILFSRSQ